MATLAELKAVAKSKREEREKTGKNNSLSSDLLKMKSIAAEKRKTKLSSSKTVGTDLLATLKDERTEQPQSIMARIDADIAKGREAEKVKQIKIQQERAAQDKAVLTSKVPHVSDINRSAANVDYAPEIRESEERFKRENPTIGMTPLQKFEYNAQKYNPLAIGDMLINKAGAGAVQFGADVADSVVAPFKGRGVNYPTAQTTEELWQTKQEPTALDNYIQSAKDTLKTFQSARKDYYLDGNTLQDKAESYTAKLDSRYSDLTDNDVTKALSDLAQSTGYMIPVAVSNAIIPNSGTALLFSSGYASGERQALQNGATSQDAILYGLLNGLNQSAGELLIGGALGKGKGLVDGLLKKTGLDLAEMIKNPTLKAMAQKVFSALGEGAEEIVQGGIDVLAQKATYSPEAKADPKGLAYEGLLGAGMGALFGLADSKALTLPSVQSETQPVKQTFAERNASDLSRINNDLHANLRTADDDIKLTRLSQAKTDTERTGILAGASEQTIQTATRFATKGNLDIEFYREDGQNGTVIDGFTQNGKIFVNAASGKATSQIITHELLHKLEQTKSYDSFKKYVSENVDLKANVSQLTDMYQRAGIELNPSEIESEALAKYSEKLFENEAEIYKVVRTDRTLGERILSWINGMITKLTGTDEEKYLLKAKELYSKALAEARQDSTVKGDAVMASVSVSPDARKAKLSAHYATKSMMDEIDAKYAQKSAIATQEAKDRLDIIVSEEDKRSFARMAGNVIDGTVENDSEENPQDKELRLASIMDEGNDRYQKEKVSAEEHAKIVLMTEAEAMMKKADPIQRDMDKYRQAKRDYRATVKGRNTNPNEISESEVIDAADKMDKARNAVLAKLEKRDASVEQSVKDGTFADIMQKQYDKLKQLRKSKGEDAKFKADALKAYISDINRRRKAMLYKQAEQTIGDTLDWKDKKIGIMYQRETFERNIRDIAPNKTTSDNVIKTYRRPIDKNERLNNLYKTEYRDKVRALNMSDKKQGNNKNTERTAVQFIGEYDYLISAARSKPDMHGKTRMDYQAELDDFVKNNPDFNYDDIRAKVKSMRTMYDEIFKRINKTRLENGYPPVDYRQGYFPHFSEDKPDTLLGKLALTFGINAAPDALPASINGLTYQFKPGTRWMGNLLHRSGLQTDYDAVVGFNRYIEGASDIIHHTEDLQRLRALAEHIRSASSDKKLKDQAKLIRADDTKTAEQQYEAVASLFKETRFALSNFVVDLDEFSNQLANKKARSDRETEYSLGRGFYNFMKSVEQRVAANMVALNPRSWMTNFIPLHQAAAQISTKNMVYGSLSALQAIVKEDSISTASSFLVNRRGSDPLVKTFTQSATEILSKPMHWIDDYVSGAIVRARYFDNVAKNMPHAEALDEADAFASSVIGGRSKGSMPTLFGAKNPGTKLFTQFQLEVNNSLSHLFKDLPREQKEKGVTQLAFALLKYFVGAYLFDDLFEWLLGSRPATDPVGLANEAFGDFTGYELPNTFELAATAIKEKRLPDESDFMTDKKSIKSAGISTVKSVAEELPFVGGLLGGGRIPISSALPDIPAVWNAAAGYLDGTTDSKKALFTIGKELSNPLFYVLPPFGGGQVKKTVEGVNAVNKRGSWAVDTKGNDILQYPITDGNPLAYARAAVFGKSTLPDAREWVESGFKNLSRPASETYAALVGMGEDEKKSYDIIKDISDTEKTDSESQATIQREKLATSPISGAMKYEMYYRMLAGDSDKKIMDALTGARLSESKTFDVMIKYKDLNVSKAKAGEKALDWQHWVDLQDFSETQRAAIDEYISFRVALPVEPTTYEKFTSRGMDEDSAYEIAAAISDLEPLEGKDSVSNVQKYRAIADMDVDNKIKLKAFGTIMPEAGYTKLFAAVRSGVPMKTYVSYLEATSRIDSDMKNGKAVSGSKKLKILTYINTMLISEKQKDKMYLLSGYSEDSLGTAPWHGGASYKGSIYAVKANGRVIKIN